MRIWTGTGKKRGENSKKGSKEKESGEEKKPHPSLTFLATSSGTLLPTKPSADETSVDAPPEGRRGATLPPPRDVRFFRQVDIFYVFFSIAKLLLLLSVQLARNHRVSLSISNRSESECSRRARRPERALLLMVREGKRREEEEKSGEGKKDVL